MSRTCIPESYSGFSCPFQRLALQLGNQQTTNQSQRTKCKRHGKCYAVSSSTGNRCCGNSGNHLRHYHITKQCKPINISCINRTKGGIGHNRVHTVGSAKASPQADISNQNHGNRTTGQQADSTHHAQGPAANIYLLVAQIISELSKHQTPQHITHIIKRNAQRCIRQINSLICHKHGKPREHN